MLILLFSVSRYAGLLVSAPGKQGACESIEGAAAGVFAQVLGGASGDETGGSRRQDLRPAHPQRHLPGVLLASRAQQLAGARELAPRALPPWGRVRRLQRGHPAFHGVRHAACAASASEKLCQQNYLLSLLPGLTHNKPLTVCSCRAVCALHPGSSQLPRPVLCSPGGQDCPGFACQGALPMISRTPIPIQGPSDWHSPMLCSSNDG